MKKLYSSRVKKVSLTTNDLYFKVKNLFLLFREKDYFKGEADISRNYWPNSFALEAGVKLSFKAFPVDSWEAKDITEENLFDFIEFLYDFVSKPIGWTDYITGTNFRYSDYESYDLEKGRAEYCEYVNMFLNDYDTGYEISASGEILSLGNLGLEKLYKAEIIPFDRENVDSKIEKAILKWRSRNQSLDDRKSVILELAEVFEWLKKTDKLKIALDNKDDSLLFNIINNFAIRHHNPNQASNYDKNIWYAWMFHFYLATYHAVIRLIIKKNQSES